MDGSAWAKGNMTVTTWGNWGSATQRKWSGLKLIASQPERRSQSQMGQQQSKPGYNRRGGKNIEERLLKHPVQEFKEITPLGPTAHLLQKGNP